MSAGRPDAQIVIVGGGVIGCAAAFFLAARADFHGRITVLEQDPGYANGSTSRSLGSIRFQFSTPENIEISRFGSQFVRKLPDHLAVDGECPDPAFVERGYLFLATAAGAPDLLANCEVQRRHGAGTQTLDRPALAARFPWLRTDDLELGALGGPGEGWLDPYALLMAFRNKARQLGVDYRHARAIGFDLAGYRITGVRTDSGRLLPCDAAVNAAGPTAAAVARWGGVEIPVESRKRCVFVFDCRERINDFPLLIDPCGAYVRPEGAHYLCGISPPPECDPQCHDFELDYDLFESMLWPALAHRVPAFEALKVVNAWAGHYAYNTFDQNVLLGLHPACENLYLANGFSGHGLQQAPAVGRALSELIAAGSFETLDLSRFSPQRVLDNRPVREIRVV